MKLPFKYSTLSLAVALPFSVYANQTTITETDQDEAEIIEVVGHKLSSINHDTAASVSVIASEEINRNQESELVNLLKELPGVGVTGSGSPLSGQPSIRGLYGERIHVSIDNVKRKTDSDGDQNIAQINSLGIDPSQLKQVQVLRGPDSLTVGSGALGGSIRLVTKDASDYLNGEQGFGSRLSLAHQSATDALTYNASAFQLSGQFDTVFHISRTEFSDIDVVGDETQREDKPVAALDKIKNDSQRSNISLKNTWFIDDQQTLRSKLDWSKTESNDQPYGQRQDLAIAYPTLSEDYENDYKEASIHYRYYYNQWLDLDIQAAYSDKGYKEQTKGYITRRGNKISFAKTSEGESKRQSLRIANLSEFDSYIKHKLALELNWEKEGFKQSEYKDGTSSSFYGDSNAENLSFAVIDQAELFSGHLLATAGLRYDSYDRSNNIFSDYAHNDDSELSKELSLTFKLTDNINLYLKSAEAFRAPSVQELYKKDEWRCHIGGKICYQEPQPNLKPETSDNLEAGFGFAWNDLAYADRLNLKVIYFDNKIKNYIRNVPFMYYIDAQGNKQPGAPGPGPSDSGVPMATHRDYSAKNIAKLTSQGFEIELDYQWQKFSTYLGYSSMNMDVVGTPNFFLGNIDSTKQPYSDAPADKLTVNMNYQILDELNLGLQWLSYKEQKRLNALYTRLGYGTDSYQVYNLNLSYEGSGHFSGLTLVAGIDNLTDERYIRAPASEARTPSETGRNYKFTLSYQF